MAIILRSVKGAPLTNNELDGNFTDLDGRVTSIEDGGGSDGPRQIDFIEQVGNTLIVHYSDTTQDGPFDLGTLNLRFRGEWVASTSYLIYDIVTAGGATYMVLLGHTSGLTFDAGANDGLGHDYYGLLLENPSISTPSGGLEGQALVKLSDASYDTGWRTRGVPADGVLGDILFKTSSEDGDFEWRDPGALTAPPIGTVAFDVFTINSEVYANTYFRCTDITGCEAIIPLDSFVSFPIGTELHFRQCTSSGVTITGDADTDDEVILNTIVGYDARTDIEGAVITVKKVNDNEWDVFGLLAATDSSDSDSV